MNWIEITATIFGFLCVFFTIRQNILCWPTGLIQVILYIIIFYQVKLYSDLGLHVVYVFLQLYGWYHWLYGGKNKSKLKISTLPIKILIIWILGGFLGTYILGYIMKSYTDAALPYADAFTTVMSLIAQYLLAKKRLESWYFWIAVDIIAIGVYLIKKLYFTSGLYTCFLVMAIIGLIAWRKSHKKVIVA